MDISSILFGPDGRLLSGWRFTIFSIAFVVLGGIFQVMVVLAFGAGTGSAPKNLTAFRIFEGLAFLIPALFIGWLCNRYFDGLPIRTLGASFLNGWGKHFVSGLAVGALTLSLAAGVAVLFGGLSFTFDTSETSSIIWTLCLSFLVFTVSAAWEEALFRGYALQTFLHSGHKWFGSIFLALLFATMHVSNPRADTLSWINTFIAGIWFTIGYFKTQDLWFPFGLHLMWNWMQGAFFGIEVSGLTSVTSAPLFKEIDRGPGWLTGESYGIEAGVACTFALILSTAAIYFFPTKKIDQD